MQVLQDLAKIQILSSEGVFVSVDSMEDDLMAQDGELVSVNFNKLKKTVIMQIHDPATGAGNPGQERISFFISEISKFISIINKHL